jgi:hypothetical protein
MLRKNNIDICVAIVFCVCFFFLYSHFGLRLAQGIYFDYLNLAFDFDPPYFIDYLVGKLPTSVNYKHPLSMVFRPFADLFLLTGFPPKAAAALVMALFGALTVALVYGFTRMARFGRPEAIAATLFFGCSSTTLFTSIIVESYGWANFSIVLVWFLFVWSAVTKQTCTKSKLITAIFVAGVTITNVMHAIVAELFSQMRSGNFKRAVVRTVVFGLVIGLGLLVMLAVLQPQELWNTIAHPIQTAKEIYWLRTKEANSSIADLLLTFFGYSFFSPAFSKVALSPNVVMIDFRAFTYASLEQVAVIAWWIFALIGVVLGLKNMDFRMVAMPLLVVVAFNVLLHLDYQFRGSVYIYAAHLHFPIFALGMGAAPWISSQRRAVRLGYVGLLLALATAALVMNTRRASEFVVMFDTLAYPPDAAAIRR